MKPSNNPWVLEKTRTCFDRQCPLTQIPYIFRPDGTKGCIWCGDDLKTKHHAQRYCKDKACSASAYVWGYPQSRDGLIAILRRQNWHCAGCNFDYAPTLISRFPNFQEEPAFRLAITLKRLDKKYWPEVDHILAIIKGGASLGIDNHQVLCYTCHKAKTKLDVKGPRRIKTPEEILKKLDKKNYDSINEKLGPFMKEHYTFKDHSSVVEKEANNKKYREVFLTQMLTTSELESLIRRYEKYPESPNFPEATWAREILNKRLNPG